MLNRVIEIIWTVKARDGSLAAPARETAIVRSWSAGTRRDIKILSLNRRQRDEDFASKIGKQMIGLPRLFQIVA